MSINRSPSQHNARNLCGAIPCAAMRCTASQHQWSSRESHIHIHTCIPAAEQSKGVCKRIRQGSPATAQQTQQPNPINQLPVSCHKKRNPCDCIPSPPASRSQATSARRVTSQMSLRRTSVCARSDTTYCTSTSPPPNAHPIACTANVAPPPADTRRTGRRQLPPRGTAAATRGVGRLLSVRPRCHRLRASKGLFCMTGYDGGGGGCGVGGSSSAAAVCCAVVGE